MRQHGAPDARERHVKGVAVLWTSTCSPGSMRPLLGRTQYCLGAVVFTWGVFSKTAMRCDARVLGAYLEGDGVRVRVLEAQRLRHLVLERACAAVSTWGEWFAWGWYTTHA